MRRDSLLVLATRGLVSALETWKAILLFLFLNAVLAAAFLHPLASALRQTLDKSPWAERLGEATWPVEVELRFEGGARLRRPWIGEERWIRYRVTGPKLIAVEVDPDRKCLLDSNPLNNGRLTDEVPAASRRWAVRLRFWAQNALEFFALLGLAGLS